MRVRCYSEHEPDHFILRCTDAEIHIGKYVFRNREGDPFIAAKERVAGANTVESDGCLPEDILCMVHLVNQVFDVASSLIPGSPPMV